MLVAVGSLFTSCIDNEEPAGVKELRHAKAEYILALKDLAKANEAVAAAEADWKKAQAEVERANAAYISAQIQLTEAEAAGKALENEALRLKNEADSLKAALERALAEGKNAEEIKKLQLDNQKLASEVEAEIAKNNAKIAAIQEMREIQSVKAQQALAIANADLQNTLDSIAAYAMLLSEDEGTVVIIATNVYLAALDAYNTALADYTEQVAQTYIDTYDAEHLSKDYLYNELEEAKADLEKAKAAKEKYLAVDGKAETWKAEIEDLEEQVLNLEKAKTDVAAEQAYAEARYRMCFEAFREKVQEITKEIVEKYMDVTVELEAEVELPNHNFFILDQFADYITPFTAAGILDFEYDPETNKLYLTVDADYEDVEGVIYSEIEPVGLKEIIETFRREKVIVDNEGMAKALADAQQAKKDADSIYFAHKAILEAGLAAYVADETAALKTAEDEYDAAAAAYTKALADSATAQGNAKTQYKKDTAQAGKDYRAAIKAADDAYTAAVAAAKAKEKADSTAIADAAAAFAYDINYFFGTIGGGDMDTAKVFAAIKEYATFISQYNTPQDTVFYYNGLDADNNPIVGEKAIQDLTLDDLTATGLLGKYAYCDNFGKTGTVGVPVDQIFAHVVRILVYDNSFNNKTDVTPTNLKVYKDGSLVLLTDLAAAETDPSNPDYTAAVAEAAAVRDQAKADALTAYNDAMTAAQNAYDAVLASEHDKVEAALAAKEAKNTALAAAQAALKDAKDEFYAIYDSFWGYTAGTHTVASYDAGTAFADPADSLTVVYTEKTFVDPDNIVRVNIFTETLMANNEELAIVLYNLDREGSAYTMTDFFNNPDLSYIFHNDEYNEFFDRFLTGAWLEFLSQYETNLATLDALEAAVNELEQAYLAKKAEIEATMAAALADMAELTGLTVEEIEEDPTVAMEMIFAAYNVGTPGYMFDDFIDDFVDPVNGTYVYNNITSRANIWGEPYPVAGKILDVMKECMNEETFGDFATKYAFWQKAERDIQGEINDLNTLIGKLDRIYSAALKLEAPEETATVAAANYKELYDGLVEYLDDEIEDLEWEIYELQKLVDTMEAGADYISVAKELAEQKLQLAKDKLDVAKTNLDAAKATYDEVIAKYLTK